MEKHNVRKQVGFVLSRAISKKQGCRQKALVAPAQVQTFVIGSLLILIFPKFTHDTGFKGLYVNRERRKRGMVQIQPLPRNVTPPTHPTPSST
eukprot:1160104-Pelagomonas_calceolata.AAC.1